MNKISTLAKQFQIQSQKELENTNEIVQNVIKQHEKDLIEQLKLANKHLADNIQIEQKKLIIHTAKMYKIPTFIGLIILLIMLIALGYLTMKTENAYQAYQNMQKWEASAKIAKKLSGSIILHDCQTEIGSRICVEMDGEFINSSWKNSQGQILKIVKQQKDD